MSVRIKQHIDYIFDAHQLHPVSPQNAVRLWDKITPYSIHPIWCAMTILTETKLPKHLREDGAITLLYHDVLEDTTVGLPNGLKPQIIKSIQDMTFPKGIAQEIKEIWDKPKTIRLFKLYDKVSNLLDATWMNKSLLTQYITYTGKLTADVEKHFGKLNIVTISHSIIDEICSTV